MQKGTHDPSLIYVIRNIFNWYLNSSFASTLYFGFDNLLVTRSAAHDL
jgi:hypothetical protein